MRPSCFFLLKLCIEQIPAVIIKAGYEIPFLVNVWRPEMMRGIMLNQLSCMVGYYLTIMDLSLRSWDIKPLFFALSMMVGKETSC